MTRRSATFQEVALSHCSSSHLLPEPCSSYSVPKGIHALSCTDHKIRLSSSSFPRSRSFLNCLPKMALRFHSGMSGGGTTTRSIASTSTINDDYDDSDGAADDSLRVPGDDHASSKDSLTSRSPLKHLRKVIKSASFMLRSPKSERRCSLPAAADALSHSADGRKKAASVEARVDGWADALKDALALDLKGDTREALVAYSRFNRQVTKEAIYDFELFTGDQQKLMNRLMMVLDRRIITLTKACHHSGSLESSLQQTRPCLEHETTLRDLHNCLSLLDTIKTIGSSRKMPVVLVYRERRHRIQHRFQEKGKSNKIIFPKEKRDFLQIMGLPGKMITEGGIDFSVRPILGINGECLNDEEIEEKQRNEEEASNAAYQLTLTSGNVPDGKTNGDVMEVSSAPSQSAQNKKNVDHSYLKPDTKEEPKISLLNQFLGIRKRFSVSPQRDEDDSATQYHPTKQKHKSKENKKKSSSTASPSKGADAVSTLSCDSCSSNESPMSDVEEDASDTAVLANHIHKEWLLPPLSPLQSDGQVYIVLDLEKVGVKRTTTLHSPFLRMSVRDACGLPISREQETPLWDIINENYLRAPTSSLFIHETVDQLPEDAAIFLEIRHFLQEKRRISTLCYTFLEKTDIKQGEFICELYKPPVQILRRNLIPYTEKAFFLHFEIRLETKITESSSLETLET